MVNIKKKILKKIHLYGLIIPTTKALLKVFVRVSQITCFFCTPLLTCQFSPSDLPREGSWIKERLGVREGGWMDGEMVTTRSKKLGICFTTGSRDFLSISLEKKWNESKQRITWESHGMMPSLFWRASHVQEKCGPPLTYWQSWARPRLWQVTIFHLIFQGSVKKLSFLNLLGRLYHSFLCTPTALYSYII